MLSAHIVENTLVYSFGFLDKSIQQTELCQLVNRRPKKSENVKKKLNSVTNLMFF